MEDGDEDGDEDVTPKIEELDEDGIEDVKELPVSESPKPPPIGASDSMTGNKKRGRPRKHPLPSPNSQNKAAKGRSKTGCITCRRRKKKCDETKPSCKRILADVLSGGIVSRLPGPSSLLFNPC